ncbi:MAG: ROK family protein [Flavobacteriaceae bacterium]|nr:ROK family protein [Flavobacteriaceae bacterium]
MKQLGIDVGGSGIKGAIVDTETGELLSERHRIPTPKPSTPKAVAKTIREMVDWFEWKGVVGCSFPTVVLNGKCKEIGNLDKKWKGVQIDALFEANCPGTTFHVANDADLAGVAEMILGVGKGLKRKVIMVTIGTGLGSGLFYNSVLVPNFELGRIFHTNGLPIEFYAADSARKKEELSMKEWAKRFDFFLNHIDRVCSPDHYILGGGISKRYEEFGKYLTSKTPIKLAKFRNNAGIIGAAIFAVTNDK